MQEATQIFTTVKELIMDRFSIQPEDITNTMTFEDLGADSLDVVELVMELEDIFEVQFDDDKIEQLQNVGEVVEYIESLVQD